MRLATTSLLFAVIGCTGDAPGGGGDGGNTDADPNARLCVTEFKTSGTFERFAPPDPDPNEGQGTGCWEYGIWTFKTEIVANNCSPPPAVQEYKFQSMWVINEDGDYGDPERTYLTDPNVEHGVKVSQGGSGLCAGELELFSPDGKAVYLLRPALNGDDTITGDGEYATFATDQRPF